MTVDEIISTLQAISHAGHGGAKVSIWDHYEDRGFYEATDARIVKGRWFHPKVGRASFNESADGKEVIAAIQ